ncbi:hypothetical protein F7725_002640 [Dissostichus mawsoni]|uniref:Uncharacterized protein n=1 Tax=Dissostichus mawsoni TaxID=36200 RepID=A0A7J5Y420_DISMA|nr:hypothetical protein F7725_002640 [Dissostichus mawsoni]
MARTLRMYSFSGTTPSSAVTWNFSSFTGRELTLIHFSVPAAHISTWYPLIGQPPSLWGASRRWTGSHGWLRGEALTGGVLDSQDLSGLTGVSGARLVLRADLELDLSSLDDVRDPSGPDVFPHFTQRVPSFSFFSNEYLQEEDTKLSLAMTESLSSQNSPTPTLFSAATRNT